MSRFIKIDDLIKDERAAFFINLLPEELREQKNCRIIGAVDEEGCPEGVIAFEFNGNMVDILHLEVYPDLRRRGIGTELVHTLLSYISAADMPFALQGAYSKEDSGEDSIIDDFFRSLADFEIVSGGRYCKVTADTMWNSRRLDLISSFNCSVKPFTELSRTEKNELIGYLDENGLSAFIRIDEDRMIPELSLCHVEDNSCKALVIFSESGIPGSLELSFLMSKPDADYELSGVLNEVVHRIKKVFPGYDIVFSLVNKDALLMAKRFFPKGLKEMEILTAVSFGRV